MKAQIKTPTKVFGSCSICHISVNMQLREDDFVQ